MTTDKQLKSIFAVTSKPSSKLGALTADDIASLKSTELMVRTMMTDLAIQMKPVALQMQEALKSFHLKANEILPKITQSMQLTVQPMLTFFARLESEKRQAEIVEKAGLLPHFTTPWHLISDDQSIEHTRLAILEHYTQEWPAVEQHFTSTIESYDLDEEAKAAFREALSGHRHHHYRSVVCLLFAQIERVASVKFYDGKHQALTSLFEIRKGFWNLPAGEAAGFQYGYHLLQRLDEHLYRKVGNDKEAIDLVAADPLPNRHAALHGIVSYSAMENSLNVLIMADFMFFFMCRLQRYTEKFPPKEAPGPTVKSPASTASANAKSAGKRQRASSTK